MAAKKTGRPEPQRQKADESEAEQHGACDEAANAEVHHAPIKSDDLVKHQARDAELAKQLDDALARIKDLESQVEELSKFKDEAARARADFYNYRTRVERDREKDRILAAEGACDALLPVLDNLDRTLSAIDDLESPMYKGVVMVQKQFLTALQGLGLSQVDTSGSFDPKQHEAMMTVEVGDDEQDGKIMEVLNRGYRLGDKLLRAALVKVGRRKKDQ